MEKNNMKLTLFQVSRSLYLRTWNGLPETRKLANTDLNKLSIIIPFVHHFVLPWLSFQQTQLAGFAGKISKKSMLEVA